MSNKKIIKDDINFLEFPNWIIGKKINTTVITIQRENGKYEIVSPLGIPKHFDKIVIYYLLYKLYKEHRLKTSTLKTSRYEIAKNILPDSHLGGNTYKRIIEALGKWKATTITFEGVFFGGGPEIRYFSLVDEVRLKKETGELTVRFNPDYIKQLKDSKFYKLIDFESYKKLHRTSSVRLYEILIKSFKEHNLWPINIQSLAEKLTFEKKKGAKKYYPSDILRYLKPAINEINKKTELYINFKYNKQTNVCIFTKLQKPKDTFTPATKDRSKSTNVSKKQKTACLEYFSNLSADEQQKIIKDIKREPFLKYLPDQDSKIYAYLIQKKIWQPTK